MTMIATLSFVLALLLAEVSATTKGPAIAMACGKTNMYRSSETGQWMTDKSGTGCTTDETKILEFCRQIYPEENITNIFQSSEHVTIDHWCKDGKIAHCRGHSRSVYPYYCINADFKGHALKVPSQCMFQSQKKSKCHNQTFWLQSARTKCDGKGMKLINRYSVQRPCHAKTPGLYRAFQFVCCPTDYEEPAPTNLQIPLFELGPVIIEDKLDFCSLAPEVGNCRGSFRSWYYSPLTDDCKLFTYGGCGGNKNRFQTKEECLAACRSSGAASTNDVTDTSTTTTTATTTTTSPVEDICLLPREVGPCRALMPMWYFNTESKSCTPFSYGGCDGNENQFYDLEECVSKCGRHIISPETTTPAAEEEVEVTTAKSPSPVPSQLQAKLDEERDYFLKSRSNEIEKYEKLKKESHWTVEEKETYEAKHNNAIREITEIHQILFDELMAQARTTLYNEFQSQAAAISPDMERLVFSLRQYVMSERMGQKQCQEYYDLLMTDYEQSSKSEEIARSTSEQIVKLQERVDNIQNRLEESILSVKTELRDQITDDIAEALVGMEPVKFVTLESVEFDLDGDDEEDDDDDKAFDDYQESGDEWQYADPIPVQPVSDDYSDDVGLAGHSWSLYMFWVVVFLIAALVVVFVVRITTTKRRKALKKKRAQHQQVNKTLTPEERQLLQMQQNGFENPTYKFFEKHQVA